MFDINDRFFPPHGGTFPPEKPTFTETEYREHTKEEIHRMIDRLKNFEHSMCAKFEDMLNHLTRDNTTFKNTFAESHRLFIEEIKNEVNKFESNVDNTITLFTTTNDSKIDETIEGYKKEVRELYDSLASSVNSRIDANNETMSSAFMDYQQKITTEINTFMASVNSSHATFIESINNTINTFRETWETVNTERLNAQDAKISDAELWMKTNLVGTVRQCIGDMLDSGELGEIVQAELATITGGKNITGAGVANVEPVTTGETIIADATGEEV